VELAAAEDVEDIAGRLVMNSNEGEKLCKKR
jgi:hypothetical protein